VGFRIDYDSLHKIVRISVEGVFTDHVLRESYRALKQFNDSYCTCCGIADCTNVTEVQLSSAAIRWMADVQPPVFPADMLKVFVSPKDVMFGVWRMFQEAGFGTRWNIRVVRPMDEALKLIGVESPTFSPVTLPAAA
jgi:hypothetical protein